MKGSVFISEEEELNELDRTLRIISEVHSIKISRSKLTTQPSGDDEARTAFPEREGRCVCCETKVNGPQRLMIVLARH